MTKQIPYGAAPDILTIPDLVESVVRALTPRVQDWFGAHVHIVHADVAFTTYRNSFMIRVPLGAIELDLPPALLVKIPRKPYIDSPADAISVPQLREVARAEYNLAVATARVFEQASDPHCAAVPTLDYLEEWNAVVMCQMDGQPIKTLLTKPAIFARRPGEWQNLLNTLSSAGRWLRIFHEGVGNVSRLPFDFASAEAALDEVLGRLQTNSRGRVAKASLHADVYHALKRLKGVELPFVNAHGDFHYSNILVLANGLVCAIDPYFEERQPVYFDLASLLIDPQTRPVQVFSGGLWISPPYLSQMQKVILESYFQSETANPDALFFYSAMAVLYKWAGLEKDLASVKGVRKLMMAPVRPLVRRHFRRVLMRRLSRFD